NGAGETRDHAAQPEHLSQHAGDAEDTAADGQAPGALQGRPGGPPEGDDGALPSASREPAVGLSSDGPPAADLRRPVQRIVARDRAAPRAVRPLDQRSLYPCPPDGS